MRDIIVTIAVFGLIPFVLRSPFVGVLAWSWLSYMSPHKLAWGFAAHLPFAQIVAVALLVSLLINREDKALPMNGVVVMWIFFIAWMGFTTIFAVYPDDALYDLTTVMKIQLTTFITMMVMKNRRRLEALLWVVFVSIGFYGVKGGLFAALTGGSHRIYGPPATYLQENNALAVALLMITPIGIYLMQTLEKKWHRIAMMGAIGAIMLSIVASWSRGAFVAIICVGIYLVLKTNKKFVIAVSLVPVIMLVFVFMPAEWQARMGSIKEYENDASAMSRLRSWGLAYQVANDNITGGGFSMWGKEVYRKYQPETDRFYVAHSIYFHVLGEHGWIGLILYMLIFFMTWRMAGRIRRRTLDSPDSRWMGNMAAMLQVSLVAYGSGGAFLSLSYLDLAWLIVAIVMILNYLMRHAEQPREAASVNVYRQAALGPGQ